MFTNIRSIDYLSIPNDLCQSSDNPQGNTDKSMWGATKPRWGQSRE